MCWSQPASIAFAAAGVTTGAYAYAKNEPRGLYIPVLYFSLMELLQFFSYFSINQCALASNTTLTLLSYIHIAFQPVFINMFFIATHGAPVSVRTQRAVYVAALLLAAIMLLRLIPFDPHSLCGIGQTICGSKLCTTSGNWHLAWSVPQYLFPFPGDGFVYYSLGAFILPLIYGGWLGDVIMLITGPMLAYFLASGNPLEWPAVWCLYSVALMMFCIAYLWRKNGTRSS